MSKKFHLYRCINNKCEEFYYIATSKRAIPINHELLCEELNVDLLLPDLVNEILVKLLNEYKNEADKHNAILYAKICFEAIINSIK